MGKISVRRETARLYYDFMYQGRRCREQTTLLDNKGNRKKLEKHLDQIEAEIQTNTFNYTKHFPTSSYLQTLTEVQVESLVAQGAQTSVATPLFAEFVEEWYQENVITWRPSYRLSIRGIIDKYYVPAFAYKHGQPFLICGWPSLVALSRISSLLARFWSTNYAIYCSNFSIIPNNLVSSGYRPRYTSIAFLT